MKKFSKLINIIICLVLAYCVIQIQVLQNQVMNLTNSINNVDRHLRNDMNTIYNNVNNMLEEESNQLTKNEWIYESIDIENRTAEILCMIIPKEYNPSITKAKLLGDKEILLNYNNGKYTAKVDIPLFKTTELNQVTLDDNGTVRTQELDWYITPRYEALIQAYVHSFGSSRGTIGKDEYIWNANNTIEFNIEKNGTFDIKKIELVEMIDGKEINRIKVDISSQGQKKYAEELSKKGESIPENVGQETGFDGYATFIYPYKREMRIPNGSEFKLYADVVDENNLIHRSFLEYVPVKKDGNIDNEKQKEFEIYRFDETIMILDENGEILYQLDTELFK